MISIVTSPTVGYLGALHEFSTNENSVLIFQMPRETKMLSNGYLETLTRHVKGLYPDKKIIFMGNDVDVYELAGPDAVLLRLKGLL